MTVNSTTVLAWVGGLSPFALMYGGYLVNRRINDANRARTEAEARLAAANADKTDAEVQTTIIANTKALLAEARVVQAEKDAISQERITTLLSRVGRMENRFESLRAVLAAHGTWDTTALIELRAKAPDYPAPPPIPDHRDE